MLAKPKSCIECPAYSYGIGYVPPRGPTNSNLAFIGQGPGQREAELSKPFVGPSGRMLNSWMNHAEIDPTTVYIDNIVRCWLPRTKTPEPTGSRDPTKAEITYCWSHYGRPDILAVDPNMIVAVGVPAASTLLHRRSKASWAGTIFKEEI